MSSVMKLHVALVLLPRCGGVSKADNIAARAARPRSIVKGTAYISPIKIYLESETSNSSHYSASCQI